MRVRRFILILLCLLGAAGVWLFWSHGSRPFARVWTKLTAPHKTYAKPSVVAVRSASTSPRALPAALSPTNAVKSAAATGTNKFPYRLANTHKTIGQLVGDHHAILLDNALIDTSAKLDLAIPKSLQSHGAPGAYIVQAAGPIDGAFRARLAAAGAQIFSDYIPNDALLVQLSAAAAGALASQPGVQAVIPYEPYYKVQAALLPWAGQTLPAGAAVNVGVFPGGAPQAIQQIQAAGGTILSQSGDILRVAPPADWTALAQLPAVHIVEPSYRRVAANDLARVTLGVSANTLTSTNYLNLYGSNVIVEVNDSGIDTNHPDFGIGGFAGSPDTVPPNRVLLDSPISGVDTNGHGTHVAGIIAGNGSESYTVPNTPEGSVTNADFRGKAPLALLYSVAALNNGGNNDLSDQYLQEAPALTNALISNNSWRYLGDDTYDLAAASYDAATRDALPGVTGSQPVLFVFAAGNEGGGNDNGGGATADTIASPATAKNVIAVGAIEQLRNITNIVTNLDGTVGTPWLAMTDTGNPLVTAQVAGYSSRGNTGIGTEGTFGRFKPDVVAPGTFVVSTRSSEWDEVAYYNPTNYDDDDYTGQIVDTNGLNNYLLSIPENAVGVTITIVPNADSPAPFPTNLPIYVSQSDFPDPTDPTTYDFVTTSNAVSIPPNGGAGYLTEIQGGVIVFSIGDSTNFPVNYDVDTEVITTNDLGNYYTVLSNLNNSISGSPDSTVPPHYYRYETGTSMSAPAVSGVLALLQDFFTNTLQTTPSPALLKAMLINGAREVGNYPFALTNSVNDQGWGVIQLQNSLPFSVATNSSQILTNNSIFFSDQSPSNALATGDSHNYSVTISNATAQASLPLRVTLVWTDPPGDPSAALKLVNNLVLVVTNLSNGAVYYGNNFANAGNPPFSLAWNTNFPPTPDLINNVQNVFLAPPLGTNYSINVVGVGVNVNAVTAQTNNITQDYALVISCGEGEVTNALAVTDNGITNNSTGGQRVTVIAITNNAPLMNQYVGANSPLLGTNSILDVAGAFLGTVPVVTIGQTNQWHFYLATNPANNTLDFTNAGFITFLPPTLSLPRMGVYADTVTNATAPEANIDLYVTTDPTLTNLNPVAISNCVNGGVATVFGTTFSSSDLTRGGTKFVVDTNSQPGEIYYVGVKSEDANGSEYDFLSAFSNQPFSATDPNTGLTTVYGINLPINIPDGSPKYPGTTNILALSLSPATVALVIVTNQIWHQNFGDLIGVLNHSGESSVLNNHDAFYNTFGNPPLVYNDASPGPGQIPTDPPGTLQNFVGQSAIGPWILNETDDSLTQTGLVAGLSLVIQPHQDFNGHKITVLVPAQGWFYDYVDVAAGYTNLTVTAIDLQPDPPNYLLLGVELGAEPTLANTNGLVQLTVPVTNSVGGGFFLENSISIGPPLVPGRYFVGVYNPDTTPHYVTIYATLGYSASAIETVDYVSLEHGDPLTPISVLDDAVTLDSMDVTNTDLIQELTVGLIVQHPRISDLVFSLIAPDGSRYLLMQNRGGWSTNGCGATVITTNILPVTSNGSGQPNTNFFYTGQTEGTVSITYNFYTVKDRMTVYYGTNPATFYSNSPDLLLDTGFTNNVSLGNGAQNTQPTTVSVTFGPGTSKYLTIIMNQNGNPYSSRGDAWTYQAGGYLTNYYYLTFTEDTNVTTTPIKFAPTPFTPNTSSAVVWTDSFEAYQTGEYDAAGTSLGASFGGWSVLANSVFIVTNPPAYDGTNLLQLSAGAVSYPLPTVPGQAYSLQYAQGLLVSGTLYVANNASNSVAAFTMDGQQSSLTGTGNYPWGLALDTNGNLYVANNGDNTIEELPANGGPGVIFAGTGNGPTGLAFDSSGNLYVANNTDNTIEEFPPTGGAGTIFASNGLSGPMGLAFDSSGNLYVANNNNGTVAEFPPGGGAAIATIATTWINPTALAFDGGGNLYIAEVANGFGSGIIETFTTNGVLSQPPFASNLNEPMALVFDSSGNLYVALQDNTIQEFTPGGVATVFAANLSSPLGLAFISDYSGGEGGTNTAYWQFTSQTITAAQAGLPLVLDGSGTGLAGGGVLTNEFTANELFDDFSLTEVPSDLFYLPEQDMSSLVSKSAYGTWQLEVLDTRAGATNPPPMLISWRLEFTFANTNVGTAAFGSLLGGVPQTNGLIAGQLGYYTVYVPTNASYATNFLLSASLPVNVWFSTNYPPSITNAGDLDLIPNSTNNTASPAVLSTNGSPAFPGPPNIVPGTTYYLVVQNTNNATVNFALKVNFDVAGQFASLHFSSVKASASRAELSWTPASGASYQVQWADSLTSPMNWQTVTNPHTTTINGVSTFTDDGSQTAPLGGQRFYRLVQLPPGSGQQGF